MKRTKSNVEVQGKGGSYVDQAVSITYSRIKNPFSISAPQEPKLFTQQEAHALATEAMTAIAANGGAVNCQMAVGAPDIDGYPPIEITFSDAPAAPVTARPVEPEPELPDVIDIDSIPSL